MNIGICYSIYVLHVGVWGIVSVNNLDIVHGFDNGVKTCVNFDWFTMGIYFNIFQILIKTIEIMTHIVALFYEIFCERL